MANFLRTLVRPGDVFTREELTPEQRLFGQTAAAFIRTEVLPNLERLPPWLIEKERKEGPPMCWVIDANDEYARIHARIWVQESDGERKGLVLRQETVIRGDNGEDIWVVERD